MKSLWPRGRGILFVVLALTASTAFAEHTRHWRQSTYEEFLKGTPKGIALRSDGRLALAPRFTAFADANASFLWALRLDARGRLYAAGGSPAKVVCFDAEGRPTAVFESGELSAQALAFDSRGNLYVATSPDGKVYRVTPQGEKSVFFDPGTKYIWDLAFAADGTLYVATGDKGQIFVVNSQGQGKVFYSTDETHIRVLALDGKGHLLAGTEPSGRILRITLPGTRPTGANAKTTGVSGEPEAFVLYETAKKEVTTILVDAAGNVYASAIGDKQRVAPGVSLLLPQAMQGQVIVSTGMIVSATVGALSGQQQPGAFVPFPQLNSSAVFRLGPDGAPEELWSSREELVYAMGFSADGKLLIGTGNNGAVIQVESAGVFSNVAKTGSSQVTGIARAAARKLFLCTANPGKIVTLGPEREVEGSYESQAFDARLFSEWGRLDWWGAGAAEQGPAVHPASKPRVEFYVRSGNTSAPGKEWSAWFGPYTAPGGEKAQCPAARFVQWKVVLRDGHPGAEMDWVSLAYLPRNAPPVVDAIVLEDPGVRVQSAMTGAAPNAPLPVTLKLPPQSNAPAAFTMGQAQPEGGERSTPRFEPPPQGFAQKGYRAVLWSAHDDNDDELQYAIYYRGEGEHDWRLLKDKLDQKFYSWDTTAMADGAYTLKIVASDAPSNPPALARAGEQTSDRFVVDNTPPVLEGLSAQAVATGGGDARIEWNARDAVSALERAEYSLDAHEWTLVYPAGNLSDAREEKYEIVLRGLAPGEHTLAVRVSDGCDNVASAKVTFTTPAPRH